MTTNQLIAILFPVGTAAAMGLTALAVKAWLFRIYPERRTERSDDATDAYAAADEDLARAADLIHKARRNIQAAGSKVTANPSNGSA